MRIRTIIIPVVILFFGYTTFGYSNSLTVYANPSESGQYVSMGTGSMLIFDSRGIGETAYQVFVVNLGIVEDAPNLCRFKVITGFQNYILQVGVGEPFLIEGIGWVVRSVRRAEGEQPRLVTIERR
jgi:hypothetical protein